MANPTDTPLTTRQRTALIKAIKKEVQGQDEALLEFYPEVIDTVIETAVDATLEKVAS